MTPQLQRIDQSQSNSDTSSTHDSLTRKLRRRTRPVYSYDTSSFSEQSDDDSASDRPPTNKRQRRNSPTEESNIELILGYNKEDETFFVKFRNKSYRCCK